MGSKQFEEYKKAGGAKCPCCGSDEDIEGHGFNVDTGHASQTVSCGTCAAEWEDLYTLTGIQVNQGGPTKSSSERDPDEDPAAADKLHKLLRIALDDLHLALQDPLVVFDHREWLGTSNGTCNVCLAGAVMLRSLGGMPKVKQFPQLTVCSAIPNWAWALENLRQGSLKMALSAHLLDPENNNYDGTCAPVPNPEKYAKAFEQWGCDGFNYEVGPNMLPEQVCQALEHRYRFLVKYDL